MRKYKNRYSFSEFLSTLFSFLATKLFYKQCRLVRYPIYVRGRKSIHGAKGLTTGRFCRFDLQGDKKTLFIGDNCEMGDMTHIVAHERVEIGNNVLIASKCFISDTNHGSYKGEDQDNPKEPPNKRKLVSKPVKIGNNVWIGENVVILAGSVIPDGCIIGANTVVSKRFDETVIIAGTPGAAIKRWNNDNCIWDYMKSIV